MGMERNKLGSYVLQSFTKDFIASAENLTVDEQIYFVETLIEMWRTVQNADYEGQPENIFYDLEFIQEKLLSRFRSRMSVFMKLHLQDYFFKDGFNRERLWKRLDLQQEEPFTEEEYPDYQLKIVGLLMEFKTMLLLREPNETGFSADKNKKSSVILIPQVIEKFETPFKVPDFSRARQVLALYYLFKACGVEPRKNNNISDVARFAHLVMGVKIVKLQNSEIYDKFQHVPSIKTDEHLVKDLDFLIPYFTSLNLHDIVTLIRHDMQQAGEFRKELKQIKNDAGKNGANRME
jgi:hypothetical protein